MGILNPDIPFAFRRDIPWDFELDEKGDLKMKEDIDAVNQSIYAILVSSFSDKPLEGHFGSDVESLVFDQSYPLPVLTYELESRIRDSIRDIEHNLTILSISIDFSEINTHKVRVFIQYLLDDGLSKGLFDDFLSFEELSR